MARTELPQHGRRMDQARARSAWELGDPSWADMIVEAYLDPERDSRELHQDMAEPPGRPE